MKKVLVFGSMNMDLCVSCAEAPQAGETVQGHDFFTNPGGKGGNQATAAARLGAPTVMLGCVGQDAFGAELLQTLTASGVDCSQVVRGVQPTGVAVITRTGAENRIVVSGGANLELTGQQAGRLVAENAPDGGFFLAQNECGSAAVQAALCTAKQQGLYTLLNPAPARELSQDVFDSTDLLVVNETECAFYTGVCPETPLACGGAFARLHASGCRSVVITLGEKGSLYSGAEGTFFQPCVPAPQTVDTTGAGDTFIGALAAELLRGGTVRQAMVFAAQAAALTVARVGAQQAIPTRAEVQRYLTGHREKSTTL